MNIWSCELTIIGVYASNEGNGATLYAPNEATTVDEFFANLNEEIVKCGSGRQLILMGDINGRKTGDSSGKFWRGQD
jgi:hypothetical protein